jgi:uncharacterized membrane protein
MSTDLLQLVSTARYLVAFIFICCLPGLALSYLLFPPSRLNFLERLFIACSSSIALSSLLAAGMILLVGRLTPVYLAMGILVFTVVVSIAALRREYLSHHRNSSFLRFALISTFLRTKPVWLSTAFIAFLLFFLFISFVPHTQISSLDQATSTTTGITEFYISPDSVDQVLASIHNTRRNIVIPLEIVNHNPENTPFRIEIRNRDQIFWEQSGIQVAVGETWRGTTTIPAQISKHAEYIDIFLYSNFSQEPVSKLRLWF